jgi:hypothetical protein
MPGLQPTARRQVTDLILLAKSCTFLGQEEKLTSSSMSCTSLTGFPPLVVPQ